MLYVETRTVAQGKKAGVVCALEIHTGVFIHSIVVIGLSALVSASAPAFNLNNFAGAAGLSGD